MSLKIIAVRVPEDTAEKFKNIAEEQGQTSTEVLREMIESFCDDTGIKKAG